MAELVIERGPQQGARLTLTPGRHSVGSSATNDIVLLDPMLADTHFLIEVSADAVVLEPDAGPLVAGRRTLAAGAAPTAFTQSVRFKAGGTGFLLALPERANTRPRGRLLGITIPVLAVGILLFANQTAPAGILVRPMAIGVTKAAPDLPPSPDMMREIRTRLGDAHLDTLALSQAADGSVTLSGTVPPGQEPALRDVQRWFDGAFGARFMLLDTVKIVTEPPPLSVRAAWTGADPYVIDGAGQRLLLGARLANGWVLTAIAPDTLTLQRAGHTLAVHF